MSVNSAADPWSQRLSVSWLMECDSGPYSLSELGHFSSIEPPILLPRSSHFYSCLRLTIYYQYFRPRGSRSAAAYISSNFPVNVLSVCLCVLRLVNCGKTSDRIRMLFGIVGRTGPVMRQMVGFGDVATGRGTFGGKFGARHCPQEPIGRTCATVLRRGPLAKLLWADLLSLLLLLNDVDQLRWRDVIDCEDTLLGQTNLVFGVRWGFLICAWQLKCGYRGVWRINKERESHTVLFILYCFSVQRTSVLVLKGEVLPVVLSRTSLQLSTWATLEKSANMSSWPSDCGR